jgi:hypothetical protein
MANDADYFYRILITVNGTYQVMKVFNARTSNDQVYFIPNIKEGAWPLSANLITGYDKWNTTEVKKTDNTTFAIRFNDQYETTFTDADPLSGTQIGYYVHVANEENENFPDVPVDVRFYRP